MALQKATRRSTTRPPRAAATTMAERVKMVLSSLERASTRRDKDNLARFGITADKAFGVSMASIQAIARRIGSDHDLAGALWATGWYEARLLAALVDDPARVTAAQMDRWCRDFDNWGIADTVCFKLFDQVPHAYRKVEQWSRRREEFVRRSAFALLACLALHDREAADDRFLAGLRLAEEAATDDRHLVGKAIVWALRAVGGRSAVLNVEAIAVARRLASSSDPAARSTGKTVLRELASPAATRRLAARGTSTLRASRNS